MIVSVFAASGKCKFCPAEVSVLDFGVEDKADQVS